MTLEQGRGNNSELLEQCHSEKRVSYFQIFRLNFVFFYLYVVGEVLYRGGGFVYYYASFSDFIPTFSLVTICWCVVAVFASLVLWLSCSIFEWVSRRIGWKSKFIHALIFIGICFFSGVIVWLIKPLVVTHGTTFNDKMAILSCIILFAVFLTWLSRNKVRRWFEIVQLWISPLVWLFGILILSSMIVIIYYSL